MVQKRKVEDYMKTIYTLQAKGDVRGAYIARALKVSKPTVSVTLKALAQEGYLIIDETHVVHLTDKGMEIAKETVNRNSVFCNLLKSLGVDENVAIEDACDMEHAVSRESFDALMGFVVDYSKNRIE